MWKFINGENLQEFELHKVMELLIPTGYYENTARNNKLNLPAIEFHTQQILKPNLRDIFVLMDDKEIIGVLFAAPKNADNNSPPVQNMRREDPIMQACIDQINAFYEEGFETDFILFGIAISAKYQKQGYFKILFEKLVSLAKDKECNRIIFTVRESNPAVEIYKHYKANILGFLDFTHYQGFGDHLLKCAINLDGLK